MQEYQQYLKDRHEAYVDQRKNLDSVSFQMGSQHDQWVLTLSGGALGLSLTFLDKIVPHPETWTKIVLFVSWSALAFSLLACLHAIHCSTSAIKRQMEVLDREHENFIRTTSAKTPEGTKLKEGDSENTFVSITEKWSKYARISTFAGIALFALFCFLNINSSLNTSDKPMKSEIVLGTDQALSALLQSYKEHQNANTIGPNEKSSGNLRPVKKSGQPEASP